MATKTCIDCGQQLIGHGRPMRCRPCAARERYVKKHGKPPDIVIAKCAACGKEFRDYASNRKKGEALTCSAACRATWTGIANSIRRGGDGRRRTKAETDRIYYRGKAREIRKARKSYYAKNRATILAKLRAKTRALKEEVLAAYGGRCDCCGEDHIEFLTIDHTKGDGAEHRRQVGKGRRIYKDLKKRGFPKEGYRVLCFNCNIALGFYGYCPHKPEDKRDVDKAPKSNVGRPRTVA